ncbi:MAG: alpha/beta fold hydrolase [Deltaproteobacteria bacterium]|nr:alpha/beta fold hydrolase [Deltaproteobacteria bacterium]
MDLNFENRGSGHALIILHGLFGSLVNWRTMSRRLSDRYRVFTVDLRNHGESPHSSEFSCTLMAQDLREFMQAHEIRSAHLLGHSLGGKAAMEFALTYPEQVNKLVVVDIAPRAYPPIHEPVFEALSTIRPEGFSSRSDVRRELEKVLADRSVAEFLLMNLTTTQTGTFQWRMNLAGLRENYHEIVAAPDWEGVFDKPALFITGGKSDYIRPGDEGIIRKYFPRAEIATIPGAGHWVHAEAPDVFEKLVRKFLC